MSPEPPGEMSALMQPAWACPPSMSPPWPPCHHTEPPAYPGHPIPTLLVTHAAHDLARRIFRHLLKQKDNEEWGGVEGGDKSDGEKHQGNSW